MNTNYVAIAYINSIFDDNKLIPQLGSCGTTHCELKTLKGFLNRLQNKKYSNDVKEVRIYKYYDYDTKYANDTIKRSDAMHIIQF